MAYTLGTAYINIVPNMDGAGRQIEKELAGVGDRAGSGKGSGLGGKLWGGLKKSAVGAGIAIGGVLVGSVAKGFQRLSSIENAEAKLRGLGHSAEEVQQIMDSTLKAVQGTAYGMDEAAGLSATLVASGIEPGKELEETLRLVADSATISGRSMEDMGLVWSQVASKGKLTGEDALQFMEAGIPIWQLIGDEMGVTAAQAQDMASRGEVSFETFRSAMEKNLGGAALESGKTVQGAFNNMNAAMGRFGATLLEKVYPYIAPVLNNITKLFDYLSAKAGPAIDSVVAKFQEWAGSTQVQGFLDGLRDVAVALYEKALKPLGAWIADNWQLILTIGGGIAAAFAAPAIVAAIGSFGAALAGVFSVAGVVTTAIGALVGAVTYFFTQTETGQKIVQVAWSAIQDAVAVVSKWFREEAWPALLQGWDLLKQVVAEVVPVVMDYVRTLGDYWSQIVMGVVIPAIQQFVGWVRDTLGPIIQRLWTDYVQPAFAAIGAFIATAWTNTIKPALTAFFAFARDTLAPTIVWLWQNVVSPAFTKIGQFIGWAWNNVIFPALDALKFFIANVLAPTITWLWNNIVRPAFAGISKAVEVAWAVISLIFNIIKWTIENVLAPVFTWLWKNIVQPAWDGIKDVLSRGWTWIRDNVFTPLMNFVEDKVAPAFRAGVDAIGRAWNRLRSIAMAPVTFIVDSVINKGIIDNFNKVADTFGAKKISRLPVPSFGHSAGSALGSAISGMKFASGGVLPGYTPGRDVHDFYSPTLGRLSLSGGEAIMRPEWTRAVGGPAAVAEMNRRARMGMAFKSGGVFGAYKGGGVVDWVKNTGGDAIDWIKEKSKFATDVLSDPMGALKSLVDSLVGAVPGAGAFRDMAIGMPKKMATVIGDSLTAAFTGPAGDVSGAVASGGRGGSLAAAEAVARRMGLHVTSRGRRGARTAQNGLVSLHALGRAIDVAGPNMMGYFNAIDRMFNPTELLYSPAGARNKHRSGRRYPNTGATLRNHYSHVHVGFAEGGVFDQGGLMQPGMTGINLTRKPEAVLDPRTTAAYTAHAEAVARNDGEMTLSARSIQDLADALSMRPNVVQIGTRQAGQLALAAAGANRAMGGRL